MNFSKSVFACGALLILGACATKQPVQVAQGEPVQQPPVQQERTVPEETTEYSDVTPYVPQGPIPGSQEEFTQVVGERVYFDTDQYSLSPSARTTLRSQAEWLNTYQSINVVIEGHADERGTREYNLALGARRANAVKDYLVSLGVDPSRLTTISYGKERPVDPRSTEAAWSQNRNGYTRLLIGPNS